MLSIRKWRLLGNIWRLNKHTLHENQGGLQWLCELLEIRVAKRCILLMCSFENKTCKDLSTVIFSTSVAAACAFYRKTIASTAPWSEPTLSAFQPRKNWSSKKKKTAPNWGTNSHWVPRVVVSRNATAHRSPLPGAAPCPPVKGRRPLLSCQVCPDGPGRGVA